MCATEMTVTSSILTASLYYAIIVTTESQRCINVSTQRQNKSREIFQSFVCTVGWKYDSPKSACVKATIRGVCLYWATVLFFTRKPVLAYFQDLTTLTFMTQKLISLWENERSGLMNSALMSTFMIRSLPVLVPIIAWQNMRSFTFCGLVKRKK